MQIASFLAILNLLGVINRIPFEVSAPSKISLEEGLHAFYRLREEANANGIQDMTLDEINAEIGAVRRESR